MEQENNIYNMASCHQGFIHVHNPAYGRWLRRTKQVTPNLRLFCFPYAGGSARVFRSWQDWFAPEVEIVAVELPGRGFHVRSPLIDNMDTMIERVLKAVDPLLDLPFAVFGHSMGALIAFELCRALSKTRRKTPNHLFVSGMCAPHMVQPRKPTHLLPDGEF